MKPFVRFATATARLHPVELCRRRGIGSPRLRVPSKNAWKTWRAIPWEPDADLAKLVHHCFPDVIHCGDNPQGILKAMSVMDRSHKAHVIITGGPLCKDNTRSHEGPPGGHLMPQNSVVQDSVAGTITQTRLPGYAGRLSTGFREQVPMLPNYDL